MIRLTTFLFALFAALLPFGAQAADYPSKAVTIIVPYPPGGTADIFARYIAAGMSKAWKQDVIVQDHPGAGGNIASSQVAHAKADGYTLLLGTSGSNAVNPSLYKHMPYNAAKQMTVIATVARTANMLVVGPHSKASSIKDLLAMARANPGKVTYASSGNGSVLHLSGVMLANKANVNMVHVPYKGTPPALLDVMAGRVDFMIANGPSVVGDVHAGKLKALAVTTSDRSDALPNVPTMIQAGVPGYDLSSWFAVMGQSGIPKAIRDKINTTVDAILAQDNTKKRFASMGASPLSMNADQAGKFFQSELKKWGELVHASGAKVD
jgi:tripartite-type tricarboxylate transporter receptor subunit TctC